MSESVNYDGCVRCSLDTDLNDSLRRAVVAEDEQLAADNARVREDGFYEMGYARAIEDVLEIVESEKSRVLLTSHEWVEILSYGPLKAKIEALSDE